MGPVLGKDSVAKGTPPPRSLRIMELAGNWRKIYGAQRVTGKILRNKELALSRILARKHHLLGPL